MRSLLLAVLLAVVHAQTSIVSRVTGDRDGNGHIDSLTLSFNSAPTVSQVNAALTAGAFVVTGYIVNATVGYKSLTGTSGYITLAELVSFDTGAKPATQYTVGSTPIGTVPSDSSVVHATDGAAPVLLAVFGYASVVNSAVNAEFSEPVQTGTPGSFTFTLAPANFDVDNSGCADTTSVFTTFTDLNSDADASDKYVTLTVDTQVQFQNPDLGSIGCTVVKTDAVNTVFDLAGNLVIPTGGVVVSGGVSPNVAASATFAYLDVDSNGKIDHIRITSPQSWRDNSFFPAVWTQSTLTTPPRSGYGLTTGSGDSATVTNDQFFYITFTEGSVPDTNVSMTLTAPLGSSPPAEDWRGDPAVPQTAQFNSGRLISPNGAIVADAAPPVMIFATTVDANNNGFVDGVVLTFSEPVVDATVFAADFSLTNPSYTIASITTGASVNDAIVTLVVTEATSPDGASTPNVTYAKSATRLTDVVGNPMVGGSRVQASDGVVPVLLSASGLPVSTSLTITFSEPVVGSGSGGSVLATDFEYHDGNMGGATSMPTMGNGDGRNGVVQGTVSPAFAQSDFDGTMSDGDSINAKAGSIRDLNGNAVPATIVGLVGPSAAFQLVTAVWLCAMLAAIVLFAM